MNRLCPECEHSVLSKGDPVPFEENDKIGTLHFCSDACRQQYLDGRAGE